METAIWSVLAAIAIALILRGLPWIVRTAVRQVVSETLDPLADRLDEHMTAEERERDAITRSLAEITAQLRAHEREHDAIDERLRRIEDR